MASVWTRRNVLQAGVGLAATAVASAQSGAPAPWRPPDVELVLSAGPAQVSLLDGPATRVWRFSARLLRGPANTVSANSTSYLGPTLRLRRGQRVRIHFDNTLGEPSIVHWHGLHVPEPSDGHPLYAIPSGRRFTYDYEVVNRAGTYWYHPHPDARTGPQVYGGLAGLLLVSDDEEARLALPDGDHELTLVLQDRSFDDDNQLIYAPNRMLGMLGGELLVNGERPQPREVQPGPHRLRLLNGSNSRVYDLAWSDGSPLWVIGTDGGLLDAPRAMPHVVLAPAQRIELWANFGRGPASDVWLQSREFDAPNFGMGDPRRSGAAWPNGAPRALQRFVMNGVASGRARPPERLLQSGTGTALLADSPRASKTFATQMRMMRWLLNGRSYEGRAVAENEHVRLGTSENWEFWNVGGMMSMPHPIHLHGPQFRVLSREAGSASTLRDGLLDDGWLDTFLLLPGDRVRLRVRFERYPGLFLYHCHNLEHEDLGMMRNYLVEA